MKALITGGAGFVGTALEKLLHHEGHHTRSIDTKLGTPGFETFTGYTDYDVIFHLAADHFLPVTEANPRRTLELNYIAFDQFLRGLDHGPKVILASSAAIYGFGEQPFQEHHPANPKSVYGLSKFGAEMALRAYAEKRHTTAIAARLFNVVGRGDPWMHLLPRIQKDISNGVPVRVGNLTPVRDYIHVSDVARALLMLAEAPPGFRAYNVCTGVGSSVTDVLEAFGVTEYESVYGRSVDGNLVGCPDKLARDYGFEARRDLAYAIADLKTEIAEAHYFLAASGVLKEDS